MTKYVPLAFYILCVLFIVTNIFADQNLEYLNSILTFQERELDKNFKRLSGGEKLLTDDPANYAIYARLAAYLRSLDQELANIIDLINYYQFMESILSNLTETLQRIRELVIIKENPIYSDFERSLIDTEIASLYQTILNTIRETQFNKINVFGDFFKHKMFNDLFQEKEYYSLTNVDSLLDFFISQRTLLGVKSTRLQHSYESQMVEAENLTEYQSSIHDVNFGSESSLLKKNYLLFLINILLL